MLVGGGRAFLLPETLQQRILIKNKQIGFGGEPSFALTVKAVCLEELQE